MDKVRLFFERVVFTPAFSMTLLAIASLIVIAGSFFGGVDYLKISGGLTDGSSPLPEGNLLTSRNPNIVPGYSDQYTVKRAAERDMEAFASANPLGVPSSADSSSEILDSSVDRAGRVPHVAPGYVAALTRTYDCRWAEDAETPQKGAQFKVGQTLNIAAGLVEIAFGCGAKAIIEGPAVLQLESNKSGALRTGKLTANVPDEVEGFTVHTPVVQVVSLCSSEPKGVAKLTSTADCLWAEGTTVTRKGSCLMPGQAVKLLGGLAEITFRSGAKVILQGPASLEIESAKTAILHDGRMTADVPDELEGFKIRTSNVEILSLPGESKEAKSKDATASKPTASQR